MIVRSHRAAVRGAFTLMEMLVVVAIIVLLAAIAAPMVMGRLEDAKKDKARVDCKTIAQTAEMYKLKYGDYPPSLDQLTVMGADGSLPFIEARYLMDPWGHPYQYQPQGPHNGGFKPDVWSMGPHMGQGDTQIGNWQ